jgi:carbamate kinase
VRVVVALGGNAILAKGARGTMTEQRTTIRRACERLADLVAAGHELVLTHGNGPQVGQLLLQQRAASLEVPPMPLDILGAQTQGQLGYLLQQQLVAALQDRGVAGSVVALVTQVVVDADDPAFGDPTKPVGPHYSETELEHLRDTGDDDAYRRVDGGTWRRVVPSPLPHTIVEAPAVVALLAAGVVPICAGGGGAPVVAGDAGCEGVEAVVDKDRTAALLATVVDADVLLVLTDVERVVLAYGTDRARPVDRLAAADARRHLAAGEFPAGSMGPKVAAAAAVAEAGRRAVITSLDQAVEGVAGTAGTQVLP